MSDNVLQCFFETEDVELAERVSAYINRELRIMEYAPSKVVESPAIMNPPSWCKDDARTSWDAIGKVCIAVCRPPIYHETREKISNCIHDFHRGWKAAMDEWEKAELARLEHQAKVDARKEELAIRKVFDPNQCEHCIARLECLEKNYKKVFTKVWGKTERPWDNPPCAVAVTVVHNRILAWMGSRWEAGWQEVHWYSRKKRFTNNKQILNRIREECRQRVGIYESRYSPNFGLQFLWVVPDSSAIKIASELEEQRVEHRRQWMVERRAHGRRDGEL